MSLKKINKTKVPWDLNSDDDNYHKEPWILKKAKESVAIEKNKSERGKFHLQKDGERRLSISALQARLTYHQLIEYGYKLQK